MTPTVAQAPSSHASFAEWGDKSDAREGPQDKAATAVEMEEVPEKQKESKKRVAAAAGSGGEDRAGEEEAWSLICLRKRRRIHPA